MRVITINTNGIRSAAQKGFFEWLHKQGADFVCIQETRSHLHQLVHDQFHPQDYHVFYKDAQQKGYGGVGIYSRQKPDQVIEQFGWDLADNEGRYLQVDVGDLSVVSVYFPSGTSGPARQAIKFQFLEHFYGHLQKMLKSGRRFILCGDWNIAHQKIDLKNWRGNQKNSGFLPEERAWLDHVFGELQFVDAFRAVNSEPEQYTWWSNRGRAWEKNVGWRIDYQVVTPNLKVAIQSASIYKDQRFSDHAPLIMDYIPEAF